MPARPAGQTTGWGALFTKQGIYEESATAKHRLGDRLSLGDRTFHYALSGEALFAGSFVQGALLGGAGTTLQNTQAVTVAAPAGTKRIYVNALTTAQSAGAFVDGWAAIFDASANPGAMLFKVKNNSALATSGVTSYIDLYDELPVALTTSDQVMLMGNPYNACMLGNTTLDGVPLGVAPIAITSGYYFWLQTYGPAAVDATEAAGDLAKDVVPSNSTSGGVEVQAEAETLPFIGYWMHVGTQDEASIIFLTIRA